MNETEIADRQKRFRRIAVGASVAVVAIVLFVTLVIIKPAMPDRIVLLTGPEESAYHGLGLRYAAALRDRGLEAEVVITEGSLDNVHRLASGGDDTVAFAPSALDYEARTPMSNSLTSSHSEAWATSRCGCSAGPGSTSTGFPISPVSRWPREARARSAMPWRGT